MAIPFTAKSRRQGKVGRVAGTRGRAARSGIVVVPASTYRQMSRGAAEPPAALRQMVEDRRTRLAG